jgi:sugar O-acyltransferase (sialic acid O-acetyltransferase NeuD family)
MKTYLFGAGGFSREVLWLLDECSAAQSLPWLPTAFVDRDGSGAVGSEISGLPVLSETDFIALGDEPGACIIALGDPAIRRRIVSQIEKERPHVTFPTLVHPSVRTPRGSMRPSIGKGCLISSGCLLSCDTQIGDFVVVNWDCSIGHDSHIGSFTTLSPSVRIAGNVFVGEEAYFGAQSCTAERITVGDRVRLGAGCTLIKSAPEPGTLLTGVYIGQPGMRLRQTDV